MELVIAWVYSVTVVLFGLSYTIDSIRKSSAKEAAEDMVTSVANDTGVHLDVNKVAKFQEIWTLIVMFLPVINTFMLVIGIIVGIQRAKAKRRKA